MAADAWGAALLDLEAAQLPHLAIAVIHPDAVEPAGDSKEYGTYDFYVAPNLSDMARNEIQQGLKNAIVNDFASAQKLYLSYKVHL